MGPSLVQRLLLSTPLDPSEPDDGLNKARNGATPGWEDTSGVQTVRKS